MPLPPVPDLGEIRFQKSRDAGGVLNATVAFLRRNAREVFVGYFAVVGPAALAFGIAMALYFRAVGGLVGSALEGGDVGALDGLGVSVLGMLLFGFLVTVVSLAVTGAYVRLYRSGEAGAVTVGVLWEETKALLMPMSGYVFLLVGGYFLSVIGVVSIAALAGPWLGLLALFAVWVWAMPYFAVAYAARVVESGSIVGALARSRELVAGSWGGAAGTMLLAGLITIVLAIGLSLPASLISAVLTPNTAVGDPSQAFGWMGVVFAPFQILVMAVYLVPYLAAFFVHGRLVEELEGTSLYDDLDALAEPSAGTRWDDASLSTPPASETPPLRSTPPASGGEQPDDDAPGGFRGGGFGGA